MKAMVYTKFGPPDVLHLEEVEKPTPKDNEVLIKVHAAAANISDWRSLRGTPFVVRLMMGPIKPKIKILGGDVAGQVEAVGSNAKRFQPGDEVFGDLSGYGRGGFAEYLCVDENPLALKPANLTFEEAAGVPFGAASAVQGLRKGQIQTGQKVLINGASGGVGMFAVQVAKSFGTEVTGVCSTGKMEMVRSLGADHVIDYTKEDFTKNGQQYDLILDNAGYRSLLDYRRSMNPKGNYVLMGGAASRLLQIMLMQLLTSMTGNKKMAMVMVKSNREDMAIVRELLETGKVVPVIDKCYPLSEVPEAIRHFEEGHTKGRVVITVAESN
jgi:NADPH:quinone reductase-like Zn-dependent oxidoreductase